MTQKSSFPTAEEIDALSDQELLELSRDSARIDSKYDFKGAAISFLTAPANGGIAVASLVSGAPNGILVGSLASVPAAVFFWKGVQSVGEGVQHAAESTSADTALRILYDHQPSSAVQEAESKGKVRATLAPGIAR